MRASSACCSSCRTRVRRLRSQASARQSISSHRNSARWLRLMADKTIELLRRVDPFTRLSEPDLRRVARVVKSRRLHPNQVLFRQGERADALYVVSSGRLRVSASDRPGHERILAFLGPGELVGEMGLLSAEPRSATAVASTDADLLQLRKSDFDTLVADN